MDGNRLDAIARAIGATRSRRATLRFVALGVAAAFGLVPADRAAARDCAELGERCGNGRRCCGRLARCNDGAAGPGGNRCACPAPFTVCADRFCVDLQTDPRACGDCGIRCPDGGVCEQGQCRCPDNLTDCLDACRDLTSDPEACGGCGIACEPAERCCNGACASLKRDAANCGACGLACAQGETCCNGRCRNLNEERANCGACGNACGRKATCCDGTCCPNGWACCNGTCVLLASDDAHCGECGAACPPDRACTRGVCLLRPDLQCATGGQCASGRCLNPPSSVGFCDDCLGSTCRLDLDCCLGGDDVSPRPRCLRVAVSGERRCGGCRAAGAGCERSGQCCTSDCSSPGNDPRQFLACLSEAGGRCERQVDCRACFERGDCDRVCVFDRPFPAPGRCAR